MFPVGSRSRNRGRGFAFNRGAKIPPSFVFDFLRGSLDSRITYTGSNGTLFNSSGTLTAATTNVARLDYNPSTLIARGLLIEEARTNSLRNNTMVGASAGTPGTAPTNWAVTSTTGVWTRTIVGVGTESGISYIDIRYQASGTDGGNGASIAFEVATNVAASSGQTWTGTSFVKLVGGSLANLICYQIINEWTGAGAYLTGTATAITPTSAGLATQRTAVTRTLNNASTAFVSNLNYLTASGAADITLRIGMPQLELGAFATSVISTSTVAVTRSADVASITGANFTSFWNATQGTIVVAHERPATAIADGGLIRVDDGTGSNRYVIGTGGSGSVMNPFVISGGVSQATLTQAVGSALGNKKTAFSYQVNNFAASTSGAAAVTDTSGSLPVSVNQMLIGAESGAYWNGWISSLAYYPQAMPTLLRSLSA